MVCQYRLLVHVDCAIRYFFFFLFFLSAGNLIRAGPSPFLVRFVLHSELCHFHPSPLGPTRATASLTPSLSCDMHVAPSFVFLSCHLHMASRSPTCSSTVHFFFMHSSLTNLHLSRPSFCSYVRTHAPSSAIRTACSNQNDRVHVDFAQIEDYLLFVVWTRELQSRALSSF